LREIARLGSKWLRGKRVETGEGGRPSSQYRKSADNYSGEQGGKGSNEIPPRIHYQKKEIITPQGG